MGSPMKVVKDPINLLIPISLTSGMLLLSSFIAVSSVLKPVLIISAGNDTKFPTGSCLNDFIASEVKS